MTDEEMIKLAQVSTDLAWLKVLAEKESITNQKSHETIIKHLEKINGTVNTHSEQIKANTQRGKDNRSLILYIGGGVIAVVVLVVYYVLHHVGFPI